MEPPIPPKVPAVVPPKESPWIFLGKIIPGIIIAIVLVTIGFFIGTRKTNEPFPNPTQPAEQTNQSAPSPTIAIPTKSSATNGEQITAGLTDSGLFERYIATYPTGWNVVYIPDPTTQSDKLILGKQEHRLTIYQAAFGGGGCVYAIDKPAQMTENFTNFVPITGAIHAFRRGWVDAPKPTKTLTYTYCEKMPDEAYSSITAFGRITAEVPNPPDQTVLSEMDAIVASLTKK